MLKSKDYVIILLVLIIVAFILKEWLRLKKQKKLVQLKEFSDQLKHEVLTRVVRGIAHDYNNQFGAISMYSEQLTINAPSNIENITNIENKILGVVTRGTSLTAYLRSFFVKPENYQGPFDLPASLENSIKFYKKTFVQEIQINVEKEIESLLTLGNQELLDAIVLRTCVYIIHTRKAPLLLTIKVAQSKNGDEECGLLQLNFQFTKKTHQDSHPLTPSQKNNIKELPESLRECQQIIHAFNGHFTMAQLENQDSYSYYLPLYK